MNKKIEIKGNNYNNCKICLYSELNPGNDRWYCTKKKIELDFKKEIECKEYKML